MPARITARLHIYPQECSFVTILGMGEKSARNQPHTHAAYSYKREGRKWGRLLACGTGYLDARREAERIAAMFEGVTVDANVVRQILESATAHLFVDRLIYGGGSTGYFCLIPKGEGTRPWIEEPEPPALPGPSDRPQDTDL
jgi:hypothetical protein